MTPTSVGFLTVTQGKQAVHFPSASLKLHVANVQASVVTRRWSQDALNVKLVPHNSECIRFSCSQQRRNKHRHGRGCMEQSKLGRDSKTLGRTNLSQEKVAIKQYNIYVLQT